MVDTPGSQPSGDSGSKPAPGGGAPPAPPAIAPGPLPPVLAGAETLLGERTAFGVSVYVTSSGWPSTLMIPDVGGISTGSPVYITKPIRIEGKNLKAFFVAKGISLPDELGGKPKGDGKGYLVNKAGGFTKGTTKVDVDTGTGRIVVDDKISFAYVGGTYSVTEVAPTGGATPMTAITFSPGLTDDVADNAAVTVQPQGGLIEDTTISCEAFYFTTTGPLLLMFALKFDRGLIESLTHDPALGALFDIKGASVRILRCKPTEFETLKEYVTGLVS